MKNKVTLVIGPSRSGKSTFIKNNFTDVSNTVILDVLDYQNAEIDRMREEDVLITRRERIKSLLRANDKHLKDTIDYLQQGKDVIAEHTMYRAKRRVAYIEAIRAAVEDVFIEAYVMLPSEENFDKYLRERNPDFIIEQMKEDAKLLEFPNPAEGFDKIYQVVDDGIELRMDEPTPDIIAMAHEELKEDEQWRD